MQLRTTHRFAILAVTVPTALVAWAVMVWAHPGYTQHMDAQYLEDGKACHRVDCRYPESADLVPAIILLHGGGWQARDKKDMTPLAVELTRLGNATFSANYTLGTPTTPSAKAVEEDINALVRWVRRRPGIDPSRLYLAGGSAGAHLALLHAYKYGGVKGVIAVSPVTDLRAFAQEPIGECLKSLTGSLEDEALLPLTPAEFIDGNAPATCIVHGCLDRVVPVHQSDSLSLALRNAGVNLEYHRTISGGHYYPYLGDEAATYAALIHVFCNPHSVNSVSPNITAQQ